MKQYIQNIEDAYNGIIKTLTDKEFALCEESDLDISDELIYELPMVESLDNHGFTDTWAIYKVGDNKVHGIGLYQSKGKISFELEELSLTEIVDIARYIINLNISF